MDDSEPRSLFVVVYYVSGSGKLEPNFSFLQLEIPGPSAPKQTKAPNVDYVVRFDEPKELPLMRWSLSAIASSTGDLYFLPDWRADKPLHGYKFNYFTGSFQNIPLSPSIEEGKCVSVINLSGRIYRLERCLTPILIDYRVAVGFGRYDPKNNSWEALSPPMQLGSKSSVKATAVMDDTILFNVYYCGILAYDVGGDKWYEVELDDPLCLSIVGEAVFLENTIYALSDWDADVVLALSIVKEGTSGDSDDDVVFKCSVRSVISMHFLSRQNKPISSPKVRTTHLVHLGKADFCLVEGCDPLKYNDPKPIHVTYMRLEGQTKMTMLSDQWFQTRYDYLSDVVGCFSLPKSKTTVIGSRRPVFKLDPFTAVPPSVDVGDLPPNVAVTQLKTAVPPSIYVGDLPPNVTVTLLEKVLKKYGPIKKDGIQVQKNKKGKCFAFVEFESVSSKQRAIKASTVTLEGHPAKISEKT